jgi:hypothetical protein
VPENTPVWIGRVLDGGAIGIVVPHIDSSADAKRAVDAARYSPAGLRSLSGMLPQFGYRALPAREQMAQAEALTFVVGIIKTKEAIEQIDATVRQRAAWIADRYIRDRVRVLYEDSPLSVFDCGLSFPAFSFLATHDPAAEEAAFHSIGDPRF